MRSLAQKYEVSDRGLAKACAKANIPVPPRGYWNKLQAGYKVIKRPLPPRGLAGYDLEFLKLLFASNTSTLLVGDPRQGTYSTNDASKNKRYKKAAIVPFFEDESLKIEIDDTSLTVNYRCSPAICELSNKLYSDCPAAESGNLNRTKHDGIFLIRPRDVGTYLAEYGSQQLRDSRKTATDNNHAVLNFGEAKGLSFDRVLIYPTVPIIKWLKDNDSELAPVSRSKLYVAMTRARQSVAFVYDFTENEVISGITKYVPKQSDLEAFKAA
jgi:superfamily I DNA/RNA helicase